jgi:gamma-glutamylcyclotransferase (GGCT)/AIG2-like uncharacterized protein YtfP
MKHLVFVYGTLRENKANSGLLSTSIHIGSGRTKDQYVMYSRSIPFVSKSQKVSSIVGDVYEVTSNTLVSLDHLESYNPSSPASSWYSRSLIDVEVASETVTAFCYFNEKEQAPIVLSGDFKHAESVREQADDVWYFAYGSNMNPARMIERNMNFTRRMSGTLKGYHLAFNKIAYNKPGVAFANIMPSDEGVVNGIMYRFPFRDLPNLDLKEGVSLGHYFRKEVQILTSNGMQGAVCYIACDDKVADGLAPEAEYVNHILCGCDLLGITLSDAVSKAAL